MEFQQSLKQDYGRFNDIAAEAEVSERVAFIQRTYVTLLIAIGAFIVVETILLNFTPLPQMMMAFLQQAPWGWLLILGGFIGVSYIAESWASAEGASQGKQVFGLSLFVLAEAVIFVPMLWFAKEFHPDAIFSAGLTTGILFAGLTASVFLTKHDFSWMRSGLYLLSFAALAFIVVTIFTGVSGVMYTAFIIAMIFLACGYILYYTSNVLHHYRTNQHIAAALALFSAVALLFWYVLQLFLSRD